MRGPKMSSAYDVFISYAREDKSLAAQLYRDLRKAGIAAWLDEYGLAPGANFRTEIPAIINTCSYFVALVSSQSISKKGFVQKELRLAFDVLEEHPHGAIFVVPVRIEPCIPKDPRLR